MPRARNKIQDLGAHLLPEQLTAAGLFPRRGWTLTREDNHGHGAHTYYWRAVRLRDERVYTSKYLQQVLVRVQLTVKELEPTPAKGTT